MNWSRVLCGGAGWKKNSQRRYTIDLINNNLEMFRDSDDRRYLDEAKRLIGELT